MMRPHTGSNNIKETLQEENPNKTRDSKREEAGNTLERKEMQTAHERRQQEQLRWCGSTKAQ
eukprot:14565170-Alexandrium_andersonii.AAC.1